MKRYKNIETLVGAILLIEECGYERLDEEDTRSHRIATNVMLELITFECQIGEAEATM